MPLSSKLRMECMYSESFFLCKMVCIRKSCIISFISRLCSLSSLVLWREERLVETSWLLRAYLMSSWSNLPILKWHHLHLLFLSISLSHTVSLTCSISLSLFLQFFLLSAFKICHIISFSLSLSVSFSLFNLQLSQSMLNNE